MFILYLSELSFIQNMYILSYLSKKSISDFNKDRFNMEIIVVLNVISGFTVLKQCRRIRKRQT